MRSFIKQKYSPKPSEIVASFRAKPAKGISFTECLDSIARESSIGTWTKLHTLTDATAKRLGPKVFDINPGKHSAKIAYPLELFEAGSVPQFFSSVCGNIFGMSDVEKLRLDDVFFPKAYTKSFKGPRFGIKGVRKVLGVKNRPLVGTIVKPKLGLTAREHAKVAYNAWLGGCDLVKDDENLTSMKFNPFKKRVLLTLKMREKAERETGEKKAYMPNVTAPALEMIERAKFVKSAGGKYAMVDILAAGFSALQALRKQGLGLILHAHRAGHAAFTRNKQHGISMLVIAKLARLAGVDQLHVGAIFGKMEGSEKEVKGIVKGITEKSTLKPVFPVCSGGLHPGRVFPLVKALGKDIIIQSGGGVHGHPLGTIKGARAMRQAVEGALEGFDPKEYALTHKELALALKKWGL